MKKSSIIDEYIMNISKFLFVYFHVEGKGLYKLTHEEMKGMFEVKSISSQSIDIEDIMTGKIVLVKDNDGKVLGYKNPLIEEKENFDTTYSNIDFNRFRDNKVSFSMGNIHEYSDYELEEFIKNCKKCHQDKIKNIIIKELHKRKENVVTKEQKLKKVRKRELRKE